MKKLILFMPFIGGGGVEKNLFLISEYLSNKIRDIRVCTVSINMNKKFDKKIKFIQPKKNIYNNLNIRLKYLISLYLLFRFLISNRDCVVVSFQANIYCVLICKILKIKILVRSNSSPSGWYHNWIKKFIYKKIISLSDVVIVNSITFKKQMEDLLDINVKCIFNPLNFREIINKSRLKQSNAIFKEKKFIKLINIGRLTEQKDQITLLKSLNLIKDRYKFKLLILGRGKEKKKMLKYISLNKLNDIVKIHNFIENPYPLLKQSDIFILSSKYEGLPNVLLESAVLKKIIISSDCPTGPKEILLNGKGGLLFKVGDYKDLSKKIVYCLKNIKKMKKKSSFLYKNLKRYDYEANMKKYHSVIERFL